MLTTWQGNTSPHYSPYGGASNADLCFFLFLGSTSCCKNAMMPIQNGGFSSHDVSRSVMYGAIIHSKGGGGALYWRHIGVTTSQITHLSSAFQTNNKRNTTAAHYCPLVSGIHSAPVDFHYKGPTIRKAFAHYDVINLMGELGCISL